MKIRSFRTLANLVYTVLIKTEDWSQNDLQYMYQLGEPEVNLGGTFSYTDEDTPVEFTVPTQYVKIYTDAHKLRMSFDGRDLADAQPRALAWQAATVSAITDLIDTLRINGAASAFAAETVTTLNASGEAFPAEEVTTI